MAAQYSPIKQRSHRFAVDEPEARKAGILRTGTDVDAPQGIKAMALHEQDAEPGQRLPAPADWWSGGVWTIFDLDVHPQERFVTIALRRQPHAPRARSLKGTCSTL